MSELREKILQVKDQKDTYIIPENIRKDVTILGITGTFTSDATAVSGDILEDKIAYTSAGRAEGTMPNQGDIAITPAEDSQTTKTAGYHSSIIVDSIESTRMYKSCENYTKLILGNKSEDEEGSEDYDRIVPSGYTKLEYLESTGTQYLNLNWPDIPEGSSYYQDSNYYNLRGDIQYTNLEDREDDPDTESHSIWHLDGIGSSSLSVFSPYKSMLYFGWVEATSSGEREFAYSCGKADIKTGIVADTNRHLFELFSNGSTTEPGFYIDGEKVANTVTRASSPRYTYQFKLFAYDNSKGIQYSKERIYSFQLQNATTGDLIFDLIPVKRLSDNVVGMYDFVNKTFYINQGTGNFLYK